LIRAEHSLLPLPRDTLLLQPLDVGDGAWRVEVVCEHIAKKWAFPAAAIDDGHVRLLELAGRGLLVASALARRRQRN
jgi:hypothetical protein